MRLPKSIRKFNKRTINRLTGKIARSTWGPFCIIRHKGRRSGAQYETPIIAIPKGSDFIIALTYGPEVDWYQNIRAAGQCAIVWHGRTYEIDKIEPMHVRAARPYFPAFELAILRLMGTDHYVRLIGRNGENG